MNISLKEARETLYRLKIIHRGLELHNQELQNKCEEIIKILVTIIRKTKENLKIGEHS